MTASFPFFLCNPLFHSILSFYFHSRWIDGLWCDLLQVRNVLKNIWLIMMTSKHVTYFSSLLFPTLPFPSFPFKIPIHNVCFFSLSSIHSLFSYLIFLFILQTHSCLSVNTYLIIKLCFYSFALSFIHSHSLHTTFFIAYCLFSFYLFCLLIISYRINFFTCFQISNLNILNFKYV